MAFETSWSKIKTWRRCHNQYAYKYIDRLVPKRPPVPLVRGRIIGECLDVVADMRENPAKDIHWNEVLAKYFNEYRRLMDEEREMYGSLIDDCTRIVKGYERRYEGDDIESYVHGKDDKPYELKVEVDFMPDVTFIGYIDKMPIDQHERVWVMDHKTHRSIPDEDARFSDLQLVFYQWAAPISGYPKTSGVIWDYLRTKPPTEPEVLKNGRLTERKNIDTDYETYYAAIKRAKQDPKDYAEMLSMLEEKGANAFYQRVQLPSPPKAMIDTVVNDAKITTQEIMHLAGTDRTRSMDRMCKSCSYYTLCQAELRGLDADYIRKSEYTTKEKTQDAEEDNVEAE